MKPPAVPEQPVPVLPDNALQRLLAACAGKGFEQRRDTAIVMVLIDAGPRLSVCPLPDRPGLLVPPRTTPRRYL
jgi:hypothetical protein